MPRSETLRESFKSELKARSDAFGAAKATMETIYSKCLSEEAIKGDPKLQGEIDSGVRACDAALTSYNGTMRSIKMAVES